VYTPDGSSDKMAMAIKEFNEYVIKDERVEVIALPFRDGVNIVQRRCDFNIAAGLAVALVLQLCAPSRFCLLVMSSLYINLP
jgi:hypothetical protein